jgi:superoxide dismutase, Fe-Mn family
MSSNASFKNVANEKGEFFLPKLDYAVDALDPYIDAQTMEIHHDKHHQAYITNLNNAVKDHPELAKKSIEEILLNFDKVPESIGNIVRNHGGGHANHCLFWTVLGPAGKSGNPSKELGDAIEKYLGTQDVFKDKLSKAAIATFGSGWAWLSAKPSGELIIESTPNQNSPLLHGNIPLFGIDVWEHAYYLKYQNRRADYVNSIFSVINWEVVNARYQDVLKG